MQKLIYYLSPILKVGLFLLFIILCRLPFELIQNFKFISFPVSPVFSEVIFQATLVLSVLGALLMIFQTFKTINFARVFVVKKNMVSAFLKGSLIGFLLIVCCAIFALLNGNVVFSVGSITPIAWIGYLLFFIAVAVFEELTFRSYPLFIFAERYPLFFAVLMNGILFGLAHLANPNFNGLAMLNITLAGSLFALLVLQPRNISWAIGFHFAWNFTQGILLGYKVSGIDAAGLLKATPVGSVYLSGGNFGMEGSLFCTVILLAGIIFFALRRPIHPIEHPIFDEEIAAT